ncbi:hypothetical protein GCM10025857_11540 [Alicyclobacillus contaminans]|uniref:diguanylate cyclase domain-containing protein n=1 Tax=Alicyclobacillus contaminans TaxID=392016 RepID=UPI000402A0C1|nr:GGDEF domain-containing protein [Alicyclobacillus contaminans]GMA49797.1 hypothetical protein GCM10025857_11540 [Alicyclobacillus contaminans]
MLLNQFIQDNRDMLKMLFSNIPDLLVLMEYGGDGKFRYILVNASAMKAASLPPDVYGKTMDEVLEPQRAELLNAYYREAATTKQVISYVEDFNGVYGETVLSPIVDDRGRCTHVLAITRDITSRELHQRQLAHLAYHDPLTGLANRRHLLDSLITLEAGAKERSCLLAVFYMDCDIFKSINDAFGHGIGDDFLVALSRRLKNCLRQADILCRIGGDEFVAISAVEHEDQAIRISERVLQSMRRPWTFGDASFEASISVGIAMYPTDGPDLERVIQRADTALQAAKNTGGGRYVMYRQLRNTAASVPETRRTDDV